MKVKFSDVVRRANTKEDRFNTDKEFYVGGEHMITGEYLITRRGIIAGSNIGPMFYFGFKKGQVLLASRSPDLKKAGMVTFDGICSEKTFVIETKDESILLQDFLPAIVRSESFWKYANDNQSGSVNHFINWTTFANYEFDLPDIDTQRKLSTLLWSMERTKTAYRNLIAKTDELVKSQFVEMFGTPESVTNSSHTIAEVADVQVGIVIKPTRYYANGNEGIKAFRSLNIGPMYIKDDDWVYFMWNLRMYIPEEDYQSRNEVR